MKLKVAFRAIFTHLERFLLKNSKEFVLSKTNLNPADWSEKSESSQVDNLTAAKCQSELNRGRPYLSYLLEQVVALP